jgi:NH3-dependent NAD+ synthetase
MIKAESIYNLLPALSLEEEDRFFRMCGMVRAEVKAENKNSALKRGLSGGSDSSLSNSQLKGLRRKKPTRQSGF